ncbi:MAG: fibronectin type III domain-containing protein [Eubacterium sp.]|nr:fibronectin type III domain-containing protein [Eubacterium sp.]
MKNIKKWVSLALTAACAFTLTAGNVAMADVEKKTTDETAGTEVVSSGRTSSVENEYPTMSSEMSELRAKWLEEIKSVDTDPLNIQKKDSSDLPSSYDLRDVNDKAYVTSVKDQGPWGTCWCFGTCSMLESRLLKLSGGQDVSASGDAVDLSELQVAWLANQVIPSSFSESQAGEGLSYYDDADLLSVGGCSYDALGFASRRLGITYESEIPYCNSLGESLEYDGDWSVDESALGMDDVRVTNYDQIYGYVSSDEDDDGNITYSYDTDRLEDVKRIIYEDGAVTVSYRADQAYANSTAGDVAEFFNYETGAQYIDEIDYANHVVSIVGWDDNYSKDNFKTAPPEDGAWIVKNSWGVGNWGSYSSDENGKRVFEVTETEEGYEDLLGKYAHWAEDGKYAITENSVETEDISTGEYYICTRNGVVWLEDEDGNRVATVTKANKLYLESPTWDGYFYLSYYDVSISDFSNAEIELNDSGAAYDNLYEYDYLGTFNTFCGCSDCTEEVRTANVFEAEASETIGAVTAESIYDNCTVKADVYVFGKGSDTSDPTAGTKVTSVQKSFEYAGYHTIELPKTVAVEDGQKIAVVETVTFTGDGETHYVVPIERGVEGAIYGVTVAIANKGESYVNVNGAWYDLGGRAVQNASGNSKLYTYVCDGAESIGNACIKLLTNNGTSGADVDATDAAVVKASLANSSITLSEEKATYTGSAIKPEVYVYDTSATPLTEGIDYTVSYANNVKAGRATVTVTGNGSYSGTVKRYFTIKPAKVKGVKAKKSGEGKVKVTWSAALGKKAGVTGYQIKYKVKGKWKTVTVKGKAKKKALLKKLPSGKKVTVRVRAYKTISGTKYFGSWSSKKIIKTK